MQSKIIERILTEDNVALKEIINIVKNNDVYNDVMSDIKEQYFIDDAIHGISHNERVILLACYIGIKEGLNDEELRLVLEASKYHDIGRGFEGNHGQVSTLIIDKNREYILPKINDAEINIIKALCHGHSVEDKRYEEIARLYGIDDIIKYKKLLNIVKDADALDRVRLPRFGKLDERYLRTETSRRIIDLSKELFKEYRDIQQNTIQEESKNTQIASNYKFDRDLRNQLLFDGKNYYLLRSLNRGDIENFDRGNGIVPKIDNNKDGNTIQEIMAQIRMQHRKTNLISMSEDPNIVLTYDKSNLHRFVLIRLSKDEIENSKKVFSAGEYLLGVMDYQIENVSQNAPQNVKEILESVDSANSIEEIVKVINGADRQVPVSLVESKQQYLSDEEQLEQSKKIAECKVLNYYGLMRGITHDENGEFVDISRFTQIMRNGYSSSEWLHSGKIEQEQIIDIPQILVDSLALIKQAEFQGKDKEKLKKIEQEILKLVVSNAKINKDNYQLEYSAHNNLKKDLTIGKAFEVTDGEISYRDTNMQMTAIRSLAEMIFNKRKIIELLKEKLPDIDVEELLADTCCVNQEMVTRQNNRGSQIGKNISFIISNYGYDFDDEISEQILQNVENLNNKQLTNIISKGIDAPEFRNLLVKTRKNDERIQSYKGKTLSSKYIAEAIIEGYNWNKVHNVLTKREEVLISKKLLKGVENSTELYNLYEAVNKIQINGHKFSQDEIFAIIINLAIDEKIGNISYNELKKKNLEDIKGILLDNKEYLQTEVLPISVDLLNGSGREGNKLKNELIKLGIEKDFIDLKDIKNEYVAKKIVEGYEFGREINQEEKRAIIRAILEHSNLNKGEGCSYLSRLMQDMQNIGLSEQEIYGMIINLGIYGKVIRNGGYSYTNLLNNNNNCCQTIEQYKNEVQTNITEIDILKAQASNISREKEKNIKGDFIKLGLKQEFIDKKELSNLYIVSRIINEYEFDKELTDEEKKSIIYSMLSRKALNKGEDTYLIFLLKNMEKLGLSKQEMYGMIINLSIDGYIIEKGKFSYSELIQNRKNSCQMLSEYRDGIPAKVTELCIKRASQNALDDKESKLIKEEQDYLEIDEDIMNSIYLPNVHAAKQIIDGYDFGRDLTGEEKKAILYSMLKSNSILKSRPFLKTLMEDMDKIGLNTQEIYGMMINLGTKGKIIEENGYSYSNLLRNTNNARQTIAQYKNQIQSKVTERNYSDSSF